MSKPTKEEMLGRMNRLIWERLDERDLGPETLYKKLTREEEAEFWTSVRSLIEKYGDGGPRVSRKELYKQIDNCIGAWGVIDELEMIPWLRSVGVQVTEKEK
jgi:hypothetical protein